jgi:flagellar motor component MotA
MNKSSLLGFAAIAVIFNVAILTNAKLPAGALFDGSTLLIIFGGTIAVGLIAYPYSTLLRTVDYLTWGLIFKKKKNYLQISQDIAGARNSYLINQNYLTNDESHPFLREAVLFLSNRNIDNKAFEEILVKRSEFFKKRYVDDALVIRSLVKYPIALGLVAAFVKAASLLWTFEASTQMSVAHDGAMAFVAVFWGVAVSALLFFPLSDSANKSAEEDQEIRNLIIDGMILIREKATDDHFQAYLRGYLSLNDRSNFKIFKGKTGFPYGNIKAPKVEVKEEVATPSYMDVAETPKETEREARRRSRSEAQKPDEKPFEKLKAYSNTSSPKLAKVTPQELEVESVLDGGINLDEAAVLPSADMDDSSSEESVVQEAVEEAEVPEVKVQKNHKSDEPQLDGTRFTISGKKYKNKPEVAGRMDEPVKIDENAPTTALETFKFKDLRQQLSSNKKKAL